MELCDLSASQLSIRLQQGEISSREIVESVLKRVSEREKDLNAFITLTQEQAFKQAQRADERIAGGKPLSPLDGIPVAIKDNLCTRGIRTTCGSKILHNYVPPYDATAVEQVLGQGGAVLLGKTNLDEFGMGSSTENSAFGPTRNPINRDFVPGGSSGGSAAAVAAGESILALGTDTGGSIRLPASYCGLVGIKPTYGRVSRYGLISYASSLDQIGALTRTVEDCALVLNAICGHDQADSTSARVKKPDFTTALNKDIDGLRIGLPKEYFIEGLDQAVKVHLDQAVDLLAKQGAHLVEISLPHAACAVSAYYLIATAEASSNLARYDGVKYGLRCQADQVDANKMYQQTRNEGFGLEVKRRIMLGSYVLSAGYYEAYYLKAQKVRTLIKQDFDRALEKVDCLIAPVSPCLPFRLGEKLSDPLQMYLVDIYTCSVNLAGLPGLSLNCGQSGGLPVGLQIIGRPFDEETLLRLGHFYEQIKGKY